MPKPKTAHFSRPLFAFLKDLARHNDREWFEANKPRFLRDVRDPLVRFISDIAPRLEKISPHVVADPRTNGGSMFRIYRDVRFSKDKSPYKTHAAAQFRHADGKNVHAPGYYLHLEPGSVFMGAGMWRPDGRAIANIRGTIDGDPARWKRLTRGKRFRETFDLAGETLVRPPRGYAPDHALIDDLKRKDHVVVAPLDELSVCSPDFLTDFAKLCRSASPYMAFLAEANELPW